MNKAEPRSCKTRMTFWLLGMRHPSYSKLWRSKELRPEMWCLHKRLCSLITCEDNALEERPTSGFKVAAKFTAQLFIYDQSTVWDSNSVPLVKAYSQPVKIQAHESGFRYPTNWVTEEQTAAILWGNVKIFITSMELVQLNIIKMKCICQPVPWLKRMLSDSLELGSPWEARE